MTSHAPRTDPRIARSKTALREALLQLLENRTFASVTITDIVKTAKYNRGTFYANYENKEALLDDLIQALLQDLLHAFRAPYEHVSVLDISELHAQTVTIFQHIQAHSRTYSVLTRSDAAPFLKEKMYNSLKDIIREEIVFEDKDVDPEFLLIYSIHALLGLIFHWIETDYARPVSYMQEQLIKIVTRRPTNVRTSVKR